MHVLAIIHGIHQPTGEEYTPLPRYGVARCAILDSDSPRDADTLERLARCKIRDGLRVDFHDVDDVVVDAAPGRPSLPN